MKYKALTIWLDGRTLPQLRALARDSGDAYGGIKFVRKEARK